MPSEPSANDDQTASGNILKSISLNVPTKVDSKFRSLKKDVFTKKPLDVLSFQNSSDKKSCNSQTLSNDSTYAGKNGDYTLSDSGHVNEEAKTSDEGTPATSQLSSIRGFGSKKYSSIRSEKAVALYVGDLNKNVDEKLLFKTFGKYGEVLSVKICYNNPGNTESLCYGYVNFSKQNDADIAMEALNYTNLLGTEIRIMPSFRDKNKKNNSLGTNVFFSNLPQKLTTREFYESFKDFGNILSCKINHEKNQGFILFKNHDCALNVVERFNCTEYRGFEIYVGIHTAKDEREKQKKLAPKSRAGTSFVVYLKNLPLDITEDKLKGLVTKFGEVSSLFLKPVLKLNASWSLITYVNEEDAKHAIESLHETDFELKKISCTWAKKRSSEACDSIKNDESGFLEKENWALVFKRVPDQFPLEYLKHICYNFGAIKSIHLENRVETGDDAESFKDYLIVMENEAQVISAVEGLKRYPAFRGQKVEIASKKVTCTFLDNLKRSNLLLNQEAALWNGGEATKRFKNPHFANPYYTIPGTEFKYPPQTQHMPFVFKNPPVMIPISPQMMSYGGLNGSVPFIVPNMGASTELSALNKEKIMAELKDKIDSIIRNSEDCDYFDKVSAKSISEYVFEKFWFSNITALNKHLATGEQGQESLLESQVRDAAKALTVNNLLKQ